MASRAVALAAMCVFGRRWADGLTFPLSCRLKWLGHPCEAHEMVRHGDAALGVLTCTDAVGNDAYCIVDRR